MKTAIITLIVCLTCSLCNAQEGSYKTSSEIRGSIVLVYGGIFFEPLNKYSNKSDSIKCKDQEEEYYLNGLQINKEQFMKLNLSHKDLSNDSTTIFNRRSKLGYGTYEYHFQKGRDCSNKITYRMEVKLPFFVNGKEINQESQNQKLSGIEILTIERKNSFFGTDEIHIKANR